MGLVERGSRLPAEGDLVEVEPLRVLRRNSIPRVEPSRSRKSHIGTKQNEAAQGGNGM